MVATQDHTSLWIYAPGLPEMAMPMPVMLEHDGDVFHQSSMGDHDNLTGTVIASDEPVAVFSGNVTTTYGQSAGGLNSPDMAMEQMMPTGKWSRQYIAAHLPPQKGTCDSIFPGNAQSFWQIIASADATVTFSSASGQPIPGLPDDMTQHAAKGVPYLYFVSSSEDFIVQSDKPILVTQGMDCEPTLASAIPGDAPSDVQVFTLAPNFDHLLAIVRKIDVTNSRRVKLDNNDITSLFSRVSPAVMPGAQVDNGFEVAHVPVPPCLGTVDQCVHTLTGAWGMTLRGMDTSSSYSTTFRAGCSASARRARRPEVRVRKARGVSVSPLARRRLAGAGGRRGGCSAPARAQNSTGDPATGFIEPPAMSSLPPGPSGPGGPTIGAGGVGRADGDLRGAAALGYLVIDDAGLRAAGLWAIPSFYATGGFGQGTFGFDLGVFVNSATGRYRTPNLPVNRLGVDAMLVIRPFADFLFGDSYDRRVLRTLALDVGLGYEQDSPHLARARGCLARRRARGYPRRPPTHAGARAQRAAVAADRAEIRWPDVADVCRRQSSPRHALRALRGAGGRACHFDRAARGAARLRGGAVAPADGGVGPVLSASRPGRRSWRGTGCRTRNLFSFTFPDYPDLDAAWLFEVGAAALYARGGFPAVVIAKTAVLLAAFGAGVRALPAPRRGAGRRRAGARRRRVRGPRTVRRTPARLLAAGVVGVLFAIDVLVGRTGKRGARRGGRAVRGRRAVGQLARGRLRRARPAGLRGAGRPADRAPAARRAGSGWRRLAQRARCSRRRSASACSAICSCT